MRAQLLHLSGPYRGRTIIYSQEKVLLGSSDEAGVRYESDSVVMPRHAELVYYEEACAFHIKALQGDVFVNHRQVREVVLELEDLVEVGRDGPKFRFFIHTTPGKVCKPVRRMLTDARDVGTSSGFRAFTQTIRRDLIHHSTPRLRLGVLAILVAVIFVASYVGGWLGGKESLDREEDRENVEVQYLRGELAKLMKKSEEFDKKQLQDQKGLEKLRAELAERTKVLDQFAEEDLRFKKVLNTYSKGVCLLHGRYGFKVEKDGKLTPVTDGDGDPVEIEYVGSGFLATQEGHVVTNRHVAQPWWQNPAAERLIKKGLKAEFLSLKAVFPGRLPVEVDTSTIELSGEGVDLAVMRVEVKDIPILPLHKGKVSDLRGDRVVLIGYPTGMQAIMARAEPGEINEVMDTASNMTTLIQELARRNIISPIITQGHLNEVKPRRLVHDAETTSGGSGGPLFGVGGDVIGVNFAITRDFDGSNFGLPIEFARKLLPDD